MPPTPIPYTEWPAVRGITSLSEAEGVRLAETLPVIPWFVLSYGGLRHGLDRAFVAGSFDDPEAVVIQHRASPEEPEYFGKDPEAGWSLLSRIPGWFCVNGPTEDMRRLVKVLEREVRLPYHWLGDLFYTLETPPRRHTHPAVRLLDVADIPLIEQARPELLIGGYRTYEEALTEGTAAAAIIDNRIVALAENSGTNARYADIGVKTLEPYRRQGLSSAAVYLVAQRLQARGLTPIWSTGSHNVASQAVATKVGFRRHGRGEYLVYDGLKGTGGYRPA